MRKFQNKCSCGKYNTAADMGLGIAYNAARMHIMLSGNHHVKITDSEGQLHGEVVKTEKRAKCPKLK